MSFDDYREGSATSAYRQEAEQIYQLAEKVAETRYQEQFANDYGSDPALDISSDDLPF